MNRPYKDLKEGNRLEMRIYPSLPLPEPTQKRGKQSQAVRIRFNKYLREEHQFLPLSSGREGLSRYKRLTPGSLQL